MLSGVLFRDVRTSDRPPKPMLPRSHAASGRVKDPSAIAWRDRDLPRDAPEVPSIIAPVVAQKLRVEADEDGVISPRHLDELPDAYAEEDAVSSERRQLARREHLVKD